MDSGPPYCVKNVRAGSKDFTAMSGRTGYVESAISAIPLIEADVIRC